MYSKGLSNSYVLAKTLCIIHNELFVELPASWLTYFLFINRLLFYSGGGAGNITLYSVRHDDHFRKCMLPLQQRIPLSNELFPASSLLHFTSQPHNLLLQHLLLPQRLLLLPHILPLLPSPRFLLGILPSIPLLQSALPLSLPLGPLLPHLQTQSAAINVAEMLMQHVHAY